MGRRCVEVMGCTGSLVGVLLLTSLVGCGRSNDAAVAPRAAAPTAGSYFDPFRLQRVNLPADRPSEPGKTFPAVLVPAEPTPIGYLAPPPLQMIAATEGPQTLPISHVSQAPAASAR